MASVNEKMLKDGFKTIISFANLPNIKLFEKEITPPGIDGGGPIDITTMRSDEWRQMYPKSLKTLTEITVNAAYATKVYDGSLKDQINVNQLITITFPDASQYEFYGWINSFTPGSHVEGEQPMASVSIQPSNTDLDGNEIDPAYIPPPDDSSG